MAQAAVSVGAYIEDYEILESLGEGGQAAVWKAVLRQGGRTEPEDDEPLVAIRALRPNATDWERHRLVREAAVLGTSEVYDHPNIVTIVDGPYGLDEAPPDPDATDITSYPPALVLEFLGSRSLHDVIHESSRVTTASQAEACVRALAPVLHALAVLLAHGVIHRDVKPKNIMCLPEDGACIRLVLVDFGLATRVDDDLTSHEPGQGTNRYRTDWSTWASFQNDQWKRTMLCGDVYGWGVTLCEWLHAKRPDAVMDGQGRITARPAVCDAVADDENLPEWLRVLCDGCTRVDPDECWTIHEALAFLAKHLDGPPPFDGAIPEEPDFSAETFTDNFDPSIVPPDREKLVLVPVPEASSPDPLEHVPRWEAETTAALAYFLVTLMVAVAVTIAAIPYLAPME